jgi:hypothetical protein
MVCGDAKGHRKSGAVTSRIGVADSGGIKQESGHPQISSSEVTSGLNVSAFPLIWNSTRFAMQSCEIVPQACIFTFDPCHVGFAHKLSATGIKLDKHSNHQ